MPPGAVRLKRIHVPSNLSLCLVGAFSSPFMFFNIHMLNCLSLCLAESGKWHEASATETESLCVEGEDELHGHQVCAGSWNMLG